MKVFSAIQMKELDSYTIENEPISSIDLMERAANAIFREIISKWDAGTPVVVFAGHGNNGGDALALARMLYVRGYDVKAYLFKTEGKLSDDCLENQKRLEKLKDNLVTEVTSQFEPPRLTARHLVIDGLFGTGLNKPLDGGYAALVKFINASDAKVVSIDIPSGLQCEGDNIGNWEAIIRADYTYTFQCPKLPLLLADAQPFVGHLKVLDIGLSKSKMAELKTDIDIVEKADVAKLIKPRLPFSHKGNFGHALIIAGQYGMAGAAVLATKACLRSGVGKVTVHTPQRNNDILQISVPEAIISLDDNDYYFSNSIDTDTYGAMAIGSGIGTSQTTATAFLEQLEHTNVPMVVDADGLNILGLHKSWIQQLPHDTILTPHPLEFRRIANRCGDSMSALAEARKMSTIHKLVVILKGHYTQICTPDGHVYINPTGNPGMATAGSGDVLSGIIVSLLAQKFTTKEAAVLGTYLHGLAGDLAASEIGEECMTASDIIAYLPKAFNAIKS